MIPTTDPSQLRPLLNQLIAKQEDKSTCSRFRRCSVICQPATMLIILGLCIIALVYPFWSHANLLSSSSHPLVTSSDPISTSTNKKLISSSAITDFVSSLPGLTDSLTFNHYSGYVDALEGRQIHYWYFEAQNNPDTAPLFFWTNGGPGCSGLTGLLTEHGPFWTDSGNTLMVNPYSWNTEVNMVYLEQPYGVGFSSVSSGFSYISGDSDAVNDFDAVIRSFITLYPQFTERDIYLSSESFGGHYMPLTALKILENNSNGFEPNINLRGFMLGNPYTNYYENTIGAIEAFYGHGLMKNSLYESWNEECYDNEDAMDTNHCIYLYMLAYYEADNIDHYALDFDYCTDDESWNKNRKHLLSIHLAKRPINKLLNQFKTENEWNDYNNNKIAPLLNRKRLRKHRKLPTRNDVINLRDKIEGKQKWNKNTNRRKLLGIESNVYYPCAAEYMETYLNLESVQTALHVSPTEWEMCNNIVFSSWPDDDWDNQMQQYYDSIVNNYPSNNLKILIFSGDDDSVCGLHGTQYWLDRMDEYGWSIDDDMDWIPWQYDDQLAGYQTNYLDKNGNIALYLHTIRTAGHMVPQTQPSRALGLLNKFLYEM